MTGTNGDDGGITEVEFVEQLREWVDEDRQLAEDAGKSSATAAAQVEAIKWFSGAPDIDPAQKSRLEAQAARLEQLGAADDAEQKEWTAAADGWQTIISAVEGKAPSS